ncbi:MAG: S-layer homology domain-containing protein [Firmicutes bacterium]|nr:S-layer homology domain-containing protein [Bacillota bacterium]
MKKKLLSLILVIIMCISMLPATVYAAPYIESNASSDTTVSEDVTSGDDSTVEDDATLEDEAATEDETTTEDDATVEEDGEDEEYEGIFITEPVIVVAGIEVTEANASNVLGDGTVKFDFDTNTLTLTDATISTAKGAGILTENIDLTIHGVDTKKAGKNDIYGTNVVVIDTEDEYEAECHPAIEVQNGSLTITGTIGDIYSQSSGIMATSGLEIKGTVGDFHISDPKGPEFPVDGISSSFGPLTISGSIGDILVDGTTISCSEGDLTISGAVGRLSGMDVLRCSGGNIYITGSVESIEIRNSEFAGGCAISAYSYPEFDDEGEVLGMVGGDVHISGKMGVIHGNAVGIWADGDLVITNTDVNIIAHDEYDVYAILVAGEILTRGTVITVPADYSIEYYDYGEGILYKTLADKNGKISAKAKFNYGDEACDGVSGCIGAPYTDVDPAEWYHKAVDYVLENGIMNGVGDGLFDVSGTTNRAMIVTMLWRLEGSPGYGEETIEHEVIPEGSDISEETIEHVVTLHGFTDVPDGEWYSVPVKWANEHKIVEGVAEGEFAPLSPVTREQLATILYRYAIYKGLDLKAGDSVDLSTYVDAAQVSEWSETAMQWACGSKIISGKGNNDLVPGGKASRVETAQMFMNFLTK